MEIQLDPDLFHQMSAQEEKKQAIVMTLSSDDDAIYRFNGVPATAIDFLAKNNPTNSEDLTKKLKQMHQDVSSEEIDNFVEKFLANLEEMGFLIEN